MKKLFAIITAAFLIAAMSGCSLITQMNKPTEVMSADGALSIMVPGLWDLTSQELNDEADIAVSYASKEQYVIVLAESKQDFDEMTLEAYFSMIEEHMSGSVEDADWSATEDITINGCDAKQAELAGTFENIKIKYWVTIVETPNYFSQIIGWTMQSKAEENEPVIKNIINSFKEIEK